MEETPSDNKAGDSAYSNSCISQSHRSSESSNFRLSGSNSSDSSGYGGKPSSSLQTGNSASSGVSNEIIAPQSSKRSKRKERIKNAKQTTIPVIITTSANALNAADAQTNETLAAPAKSIEIDISLQDDSTNVEKTLQLSTATTIATTTLSTATATLTTKLNTNNNTIASNSCPENVLHAATVSSERTEEISALRQTAEELQQQQQQNKENFTTEIGIDGTGPIITISDAPPKLDSNHVQIECDESSLETTEGDLEVAEILATPVEQKTEPQRINQSQEGFCCITSLHDGIVISTTTNLTDYLGFPRDMWIGRSFMDFVHPKDRSTFVGQIARSLEMPYTDELNISNAKNPQLASLFVLLRCYRGWNTCGFNIKDKPLLYEPFKLIFRNKCFKSNEDASEQMTEESPDVNNILLICAKPVTSIYKVANEVLSPRTPKFSTTHTVAGVLVNSNIDTAAVGAIGYLPQDIAGRQIFDFYHPEDMGLLKEAYEKMIEKFTVSTVSRPVRSRPYRFLINNGCYITLETEWSCTFNPWSRKLNVVTGNHRVLQGPKHCNIFAASNKYACSFPSQVLTNAKRIQDGILKKLADTMSCPSEDAHKLLFRRSQQLNICMENFLVEVERQTMAVESVQSEPGSVMLGEISPHHEYYDSKSSSETPPTYNQLNYSENLNRYFNSHPSTFAPDETQKIMNNEQIYDSSQNDINLSPMQQSAEDSGGSANSSTESSNNSNETTDKNYQSPNLLLTEVLLSRHNNEIEKQMLKKHKMARFNRIGADKSNKAPDKNAPNLNNRGHGIKRSGSHSWDNELHKNSKQHHSTDHRNNAKPVESSPTKCPIAQSSIQNPQQNVDKAVTNENNNSNNIGNNTNNNNNNNQFADQQRAPLNVNLWPPFSVSVTTIQHSTQSTLIQKSTTAGSLFQPTYCLPPALELLPSPESRFPYFDDLSNRQLTAQPKILTRACVPNVSNAFRPFQHLAGIVYPHQTMLDQRLVYPHPPIMYQPIPFPAVQTPLQNTNETKNSFPEAAKPDIVNTSLANAPSQNDTKTHTKQCAKMKDITSDEMEESSYSSFYSTLLREDTSEGDKRTEDSNWDKMSLMDRCKRRLPPPPWLSDITLTPEIIYKYQITAKTVADVLQADLKFLKNMQQPTLVNEQLDQLYLDLELQGLSARLSIGDTPSSSSEDEENLSKKKGIQYGSLVMIYEENAPFPPPLEI